MRRIKEVHLISISFVDMLAGALGATILLFIIVPKVSFADLEKLKTLASIETSKASMDSLLLSLENVVPERDYQELIQSSAVLQASIESLSTEVESVQNALSIKTQQYNNVAQKYDRAMATIRKLEKDLKAAPSAAQYNKLAAELKAAKARISDPMSAPKPLTHKPAPVTIAPPPAPGATPDATPGKGDAIFGIDPPLTIMINWEDKDDKVHLYMREAGTNSWVFYQTKRRRASFGTWDNSLKKLTAKPYEAIVQKDELVPGTYEIFAQPAKAKSGAVEVSGFIAMKVGDKPIKKYNIAAKSIGISKPPYTGGSGADIKLGTLTVTSDDIAWMPN